MRIKNACFQWSVFVSSCVSIWICVFSCMRSDAYVFRVSNSVLFSTFFARAKISRQISLNTKSAQLVLASSISSLQELSSMLLISFSPKRLEEAVLGLMVAIL